MTMHDTARTAVAAPPGARQPSDYRVRPTDPMAASELGRACGLGSAAAQVLLQRGVDDPDRARAFLDPRLGDLSDPTPMADREAAAERLAHACRRNELV
ncbi:MAG: hypothetical protein H6721_29005, partial [Sandaracinus sp.]|nr:hypothetical protein [Sandaracinus sp.]